MSYEKLKARWEEQRHDRLPWSEEIRRRIEVCGPPLFRRYGVRRAVVFGSAVEGRSTGRSDVDPFVSPLEEGRYWELRHELEETLGVPVDLYADGDDPAFIRKVLSRGVVVYAAQL